MKTLFAVVAALLLFSGAPARAYPVGDSVDVKIVTDDGRTLPFYAQKSRHALKKVFAEALRGDPYRIVVHNRLDRRVGVVVAVDGRNIISGEKSWLRNTERMYILEPYATNEYSGWRTGRDRVNRFYFTDVPDSYAAAFGDTSAMGVIAVAVYPEVRRYEPRQDFSFSSPLGKGKDGGSARQAAPSVQREESKSAGTGYGREEYSPSRQVRFDPEARAVETILVKYEWRETLCRKHVISCGGGYGEPGNRLWDRYGFAPPPPGQY
jgi:hypothetical protein